MSGGRPDALEAARESGLVVAGKPLLVMLSGGGDSVCLLDVALTLGAEVSALHVNYGLRDESDSDAEFCRALCAARGVELTVEDVSLPGEGNLHAHARDARYAIAERLAGGDYAAAHTATDQAETVLYRLATSPGRRALLGMEAQRGRLVRPLLGVTREETHHWCRARGLEWRDDASNDDPRFARARVRTGLLAALEDVAPGAGLTVAETARQLRDESVVLDGAVAEALAGLGGGPAVALADLRALGPALSRLVLRRLAEEVSGGRRPLGREETERMLGLADAPGGTQSLDLGDDLRAVAEYGTLRIVRGAETPPPVPVDLPVPGRARFGAWDVEAVAGGGGEVDVDRAALRGALTVRAWRAGDRMRPVGLGGSKTLADLFTDLKIPRELRRQLPVFEAAGAIVWVAGVALGEEFRAADGAVVGLNARRVG